MRINIGCGKQTWEGFYCVDAVAHPKASRPPDLIHAFIFDVDRLENPLPLQDQCADEVHAYHFIEHVREYEAPALVAEFLRLLKVGGKLILELPDIELCAKNLLAGMSAQMCWFGFYGDASHRDPYMLHKSGFTRSTMKTLLAQSGFTDIRFGCPVTHGGRVNRDMRVTATKQECV